MSADFKIHGVNPDSSGTGGQYFANNEDEKHSKEQSAKVKKVKEEDCFIKSEGKLTANLEKSELKVQHKFLKFISDLIFGKR